MLASIHSGGDTVIGNKITAGADVVGRDKITLDHGAIPVGKGGRLLSINLPRPVQIGIGVASNAIMLTAAVVLLTRAETGSVNTEFSSTMLRVKSRTCSRALKQSRNT